MTTNFDQRSSLWNEQVCRAFALTLIRQGSHETNDYSGFHESTYTGGFSQGFGLNPEILIRNIL